jgi:hypothetical protein
MKYPYRVAIIKHPNVGFDISQDISEWVKYEDVYIDLKVLVNEAQHHFPIEYESFGTFTDIDNKKKEFWGLKDPQEAIAKVMPITTTGIFDLVIVVYIKKINEKRLITSWTRFGTLAKDTDFIEVCLNGEEDDMLRILTHEVRHALRNRALRRGLPIPDVMDSTPVFEGNSVVWKPYYNEFLIDHPNGNRAVQNKLFAPYMKKIMAELPSEPLWKKVARAIGLITDITPEEPRGTLLDKWADAIKKHEGWGIGKCSYRCNNPGNIRYVGQKSAIGICECGTSGKFCLFPDYKTGKGALKTLLYNAATGKSNLYYPKMTLLQFFETYAPSSDNNNPLSYAKSVAKSIGVPITTQISELVK